MSSLLYRLKNVLQQIRRLVTRKVITKDFHSEFLSSDFGFSRGTPVDRFYIDQFLTEHSNVITGKCMEFGDLSYIEKYGFSVTDKITFNYSEINSMTGKNYTGDLSKTETMPSNIFDCIVCINVINFIYDIPAAMAGLYKILKVGGSVILTVAGPTAHISRYDMDRWGDYWRISDKALLRLSKEAGFSIQKVASYGNAYSASSQLNGFCSEELDSSELFNSHPDYPLVVALLLTKK